MSMGSNELQYALKTLRSHWEESQTGWSDQVRRDFEENHLTPLIVQTTAVVRGMERLAEILAKVRHDCA